MTLRTIALTGPLTADVQIDANPDGSAVRLPWNYGPGDRLRFGWCVQEQTPPDADADADGVGLASGEERVLLLDPQLPGLPGPLGGGALLVPVRAYLDAVDEATARATLGDRRYDRYQGALPETPPPAEGSDTD
jgi:hypothetical protein